MKNKIEIKEFSYSDEFEYCGEEECETIFVSTNKHRIVMRDCDLDDEIIEDKLKRLNNKNNMLLYKCRW